MRTGLWIVVVVVLAIMAGTAVAGGVMPQIVGNDEGLKGRLLFGDPNGASLGPWGSWHEDEAKSLWGGGVGARMDVSGQAVWLLSRFPGVPDAWWQLLSELGGRMYLLGDVGAVNVAHEVQAEISPGIGLGLGPFTYEVTYDVFEGGRVKNGGYVIAESGMKNWFGVQHVFRF